MADRDAELALLRAKLKAREGKTGFAANVAELTARIEELEGQHGG